MLLGQLRDWLLASDAESELGFREVVLRLSRIGLLTLGIVEVVMTTVMVGANFLLDPRPNLTGIRLNLGFAVAVTGLLTLLTTRIRAIERFSRAIGLASAWCCGFLLNWFFLRMTLYQPSAEAFIPCNMTLVMLVTVVTMPLKPLQTVGFGVLLTLSYVMLAEQIAAVQMISIVFLIMLTGLAAGLTGVLYYQRRAAWQMQHDVLRAAENLRQSEARNLLAQNAASVGRLAAALTHELNSPVGALVSGVDTLLLLAARQATCGPGSEQQRLVVLQNDLRKSIRQSAERLKQIVARMQRFTNLDKAEVQAANVNELLSDVAALMEPVWNSRAKLHLDLQPVPELVCRPQQLSAVFSSLMGNAVEATNGDGRVRVGTRQEDSQIEVCIEDNGRGLSKEQLDAIFDPGFRVTEGRVASGNWSMFSSRQIIREHGGDIHIASAPGQGTRVSIVLPVGEQVLT